MSAAPSDEPIWKSRPGEMFAAVVGTEPINDFIHLSEGLSNSFLITTDEGNIVVNTGMFFEAAVVARPDNKWGETPCAFITLKDTADGVTSQDIIDFCREGMAHFKTPRTVIFLELPKTSTGKVQKYILREKTEAMGSL